MKRLTLTAMIALSAFGLTACNSTPKSVGPKTPAELNIAADDSLALKVLKLGDSAYNSKDTQVDAEKWKEINGADPSLMAVNMAAGAAGIGAFGGSGFGGGLLNAGLFFLASPNTKPALDFRIFQIVPVAEVDKSRLKIGDFILDGLESSKSVMREQKDWNDNTFYTLVYKDAPFPVAYKKDGWDFLALSLSYPTTVASASELNKLLGTSLSDGRYVVTRTILNKCVEGEVVPRIKTNSFAYPTYLYIPPKDQLSVDQCENLDSMRGEVQSIVDVQTMTSQLLIKPKS